MKAFKNMLGLKARPLAVGDRIALSGGYEYQPRWMQGMASHIGSVIEFIPGQNADPAAVVRLESPMTIDGHTGTALILELRYEGASWGESETVHVELCEEILGTGGKLQRPGKWIESHATYTRIRT